MSSEAETSKRGRPPKGHETQTARLYLRSEEADKLLYEKAARLADLSLSDWIRDRLTKAASRELLRQ